MKKNLIKKYFKIFLNFLLFGIIEWKAKIKEDELAFLCNASSGDTYVFCSYIESLMEQFSAEKCLVVTTSKQAQIPKMFSKVTRVISTTLIPDVGINDYFLNINEMRPGVLFPAFSPQFLKMCKIKGDNFHLSFKGLFSINGEILPSLPRVEKEKLEFQKTNAPDLSNIVKSKTILLSPYSYSLPPIDGLLWHKIVDICKKLGYVVLTNCAEGEKPIQGTEKIRFEYGVSLDFVEYAGFFIGMRNGLCDVISSANAKLFVIYPDNKSYQLFSLRCHARKENTKIEEHIMVDEEYLASSIAKFLTHDN